MIRLSFIVPFYGVEPYIEQCLKSLFDQDLPESDYEVICVNDCSLDNSESIVLDFMKTHANLVLVRHNTNKKLGAARNSGLKVARGKYIWFVDSDDYIKKNSLGELLYFCESNKLDILHWSVQDSDGKWLIKKSCYSSVVTGVEEFIDGSRDVTFPWNRIYNRSFLIDNDLWFNNLWGGDVVHTILALNLANRVMSVSDCYYYYRTNNMSSDMRSPNSANKVISFCFVLAKAIEDCKIQLSPQLYPIIDEFVVWRVNQCVKPIFKMSTKEISKFFRLMQSDVILRDFVLSVANGKVRAIIRYPIVVYAIHPLYRVLRVISGIVR